MINATNAHILTNEAKLEQLTEAIERYEQIMENRKKVITNTKFYCETILSSLITNAARDGWTAVDIKIGQEWYDYSKYGEDYKVYGILKDQGEMYADGRHSWSENCKIGALNLQTLITIIESYGYTVTQTEIEYFEYGLGKRDGIRLLISWAK